MRKRTFSTSACSWLAILAGSLTFMGTAQAVSLLSEDCEGASNVFGWFIESADGRHHRRTD